MGEFDEAVEIISSLSKKVIAEEGHHGNPEEDKMVMQAKRLIELTKGDRKMLVTVFEGGQVSSCIEDEAKKKYCETCQADDETCEQWLEHLKEKGYQATEIELGELELEESLPKFLEQREIPDEVQPVVEEALEE